MPMQLSDSRRPFVNAIYRILVALGAQKFVTTIFLRSRFHFIHCLLSITQWILGGFIEPKL